MVLNSEGLSDICTLGVDRLCWNRNARVLTFEYGEAVTTIRIVFNDEDSGAELALTHMTTFPESERGHGYGSRALQSLLAWAKGHNMKNIRAVQVQDPSEDFWVKNGFRKLGNETNDFQLIY